MTSVNAINYPATEDGSVSSAILIMKTDIKIFAENIEQGALDDINALASIPVNANKKLRFMPDCHKGVTVPIGTCIPVDITNPDEAIAPGTVGCGRRFCSS